jgi:hypothetical protein
MAFDVHRKLVQFQVNERDLFKCVLKVIGHFTHRVLSLSVDLSMKSWVKLCCLMVWQARCAKCVKMVE